MIIEHLITAVIGLFILYVLINIQIKSTIKKGTYYLSTSYKGLNEQGKDICERFYTIYNNRVHEFVTTKLIFEPNFKKKQLELVKIEGYMKDYFRTKLLKEDVSFNIFEIATSKEELIKKLAEK